MNNKIQVLTPLLTELYQHLKVEKKPSDFFLSAPINRSHYVILDFAGESEVIPKILEEIYSIHEISDNWSRKKIFEEIDKLILGLGKIKHDNHGELDVHKIARSFLSNFSVGFEFITCILPIYGLTVSKKTTIGSIDFLPLADTEQRFSSSKWYSSPKNLHPSINSFVSLRMKKEPARVLEILKEKTERALNILRFLGSFLYWDQTPRHIYIGGKQRKRVSSPITIDDEENINMLGNSEFQVMPMRLDERFIQNAKTHEYGYLLSTHDPSSFSPLRKAIYTSIQWFGGATQELDPVTSFVKFYISLETATKRTEDHAGSTLPGRISKIMYPNNLDKQEYYKENIAEIIKERNAVFHSGTPKAYSAEYLSSQCYQITRQILNRLGYLIPSEGLKTKDDLALWAKTRV